MAADQLVILLAEDDPGHSALIQRNLQRAGIVNEIVHVTDGQAALDYVFCRGFFANRPADVAMLILLDINMPRVDGVGVLTQIKASAKTCHIPVIVLTTTDDRREIESCYALGCNVYITKPIAYEAFVEAIRQLGLFLRVVQVPNGQNGRPLPAARDVADGAAPGMCPDEPTATYYSSMRGE